MLQARRVCVCVYYEAKVDLLFENGFVLVILSFIHHRIHLSSQIFWEHLNSSTRANRIDYTESIFILCTQGKSSAHFQDAMWNAIFLYLWFSAFGIHVMYEERFSVYFIHASHTSYQIPCQFMIMTCEPLETRRSTEQAKCLPFL